MDRATPHSLALVIFLLSPLLLHTAVHAQTSTAYCLTQFSLANQACAILPPLSRTSTAAVNVTLQDDNDNDEDSDVDDDNDEDEDEDEHEHEHEHSHHGHHRRGGHHHDQDGFALQPRSYRDCCRWVRQVDRSCVCEALLRLPLFLTRPRHKYVMQIGRACRIRYKCRATY
ncbi:uncharacterized protein [Typha latifolia]|uniref:uncharacterized protein n=1 Tax=Typha latifolia TaxID=4733 RepID=UPI003C2C2478